MYLYTYIYIEREREKKKRDKKKERERERERERGVTTRRDTDEREQLQALGLLHSFSDWFRIGVWGLAQFTGL